MVQNSIKEDSSGKSTGCISSFLPRNITRLKSNSVGILAEALKIGGFFWPEDDYRKSELNVMGSDAGYFMMSLIKNSEKSLNKIASAEDWQSVERIRTFTVLHRS